LGVVDRSVRRESFLTYCLCGEAAISLVMSCDGQALGVKYSNVGIFNTKIYKGEQTMIRTLLIIAIAFNCLCFVAFSDEVDDGVENKSNENGQVKEDESIAEIEKKLKSVDGYIKTAEGAFYKMQTLMEAYNETYYSYNAAREILEKIYADYPNYKGRTAIKEKLVRVKIKERKALSEKKNRQAIISVPSEYNIPKRATSTTMTTGEARKAIEDRRRRHIRDKKRMRHNEEVYKMIEGSKQYQWELENPY